jgi:hypothetical protein
LEMLDKATTSVNYFNPFYNCIQYVSVSNTYDGMQCVLSS